MCFRRGIYAEYQPEVLDIAYLYKWAVGAVFLGLALLSVSAATLRND